MPGEYQIYKSTDTIKVKGGAWHLLPVEGKTTIVAKGNSKYAATWAVYLNVKSPVLGGPTELLVKWVRDPKTKPDWTGERAVALKRGKSTKYAGSWIFKARKGQPVGVWLYHSGSKPIEVSVREVKMNYEVGE